MIDWLKDLKGGLTIKEALNWCEQFENNLVLCNVDSERRTLGLQAMQVVKSALEKQIPKKPDYWGDGYDDNGELIYDNAICPNCGNDDFEFDINNWGCKYCPDCGHALDWSDSN